MVTKDDVKEFLNQFNTKVQVFGILFRDDRGKNADTLKELEITPMHREYVVRNLDVADNSEGPLIDQLNRGGEMWVFGKDVKGREVYIKITLGYANCQTICISFHIAEHPMRYPFKDVAL